MSVCLSEAEEKCMTAPLATLVPPQDVGAAMLLQHLQQNHSGSPPHQPANQDQGMLLQHLQPIQTEPPPVQGGRDISTVDFEQIQIKTEVSM